ncbi:MAG: ribonuclease HII [Thermoanaerobaculaceae bacterium]|nr:ribonuclease HII [Thermoanaerobaculaceae bacterium]
MSGAPPDGSLDRTLAARYGLIAGVDEVGRGAIAGPVTVAAVILHPDRPIAGLDDSKRLSPSVRARLADEVRGKAVAWTVVHRSPAEIDRINILEATRAAMVEAILTLGGGFGLVVSDAVSLPGVAVPVLAEPRADGRYLCVAAASILAKVVRDGAMTALAREHPGYGWESNKGYPTRAHLEALRRQGACALHRTTYAPVRVLA